MIKVNKISRSEFTNSRYSKYLKAVDGSIYQDKLRSANNFDDIVLASTNYINEALKHSRNDSFKEFARGEVLIRVKENDYKANVIVGVTQGNQMVLYDVIDFVPTTLAIKERTSKSAMLKAGSERNKMSFDPTVTQKSPSVNSILSENPKKITTVTKNTAENSGVKRQISIDRNGKYVEVDTDQELFDGKTVAEMQSIARNVIKERFRGKVLPINTLSNAYVDKRSTDEYAYPANRRMDDVIKESKMRSSVELDNLLTVSDFVRHEDDDGRHKDVTGGWDVYFTRFSVANNMFVGEVKIKNTDRGRVFYDVTQIKRLPVNGGQTTNVAAASGNLPTDSIANKTSAVNSNISDSGEKITKFQKKLPDVQEKLKKMSGSDDIDDVKRMAYGLADDFMKYAKAAQLEMTETRGLMPQPTRVSEIVAKYNDYRKTGVSNKQLESDITDIFTDYMNGVGSSGTLFNYITDTIMKRELNSYEVIGDETFKAVRAYTDGGRFKVSDATVGSLVDTFGSLGEINGILRENYGFTIAKETDTRAETRAVWAPVGAQLAEEAGHVFDGTDCSYTSRYTTENGYVTSRKVYQCESCEGCSYRNECHTSKYNRRIRV